MKKIALFTLFLCLGICLSAKGWGDIKKIEKSISEPSFRRVEYHVSSFGAVADGRTDSRPAINQAIEQCSLEGGGRVVLASGQYYCKGPIVLKSNVNLHFEDGAELIFSTNNTDYLPCVLTRWKAPRSSTTPLLYMHAA